MRRLSVVLIAASLGGLAAATSVLGVKQTSWADSSHGWMAGYDARRDEGIVLSTENGGRTWHRIASGFDVQGPSFVRPRAQA
jgi:hypothetical protein